MLRMSVCRAVLRTAAATAAVTAAVLAKSYNAHTCIHTYKMPHATSHAMKVVNKSHPCDDDDDDDDDDDNGDDDDTQLIVFRDVKPENVLIERGHTWHNA